MMVSRDQHGGTLPAPRRVYWLTFMALSCVMMWNDWGDISNGANRQALVSALAGMPPEECLGVGVAGEVVPVVPLAFNAPSPPKPAP